jgi:hypothetical protein
MGGECIAGTVTRAMAVIGGGGVGGGGGGGVGGSRGCVRLVRLF